MVIHENVMPDTSWYCMILPNTTWYCLILPDTAWYYLLLPNTSWDYLKLRGIDQYCQILLATARYWLTLQILPDTDRFYLKLFDTARVKKTKNPNFFMGGPKSLSWKDLARVLEAYMITELWQDYSLFSVFSQGSISYNFTIRIGDRALKILVGQGVLNPTT